jgi:hypothetical protein
MQKDGKTRKNSLQVLSEVLIAATGMKLAFSVPMTGLNFINESKRRENKRIDVYLKSIYTNK